MVENGKGSNIVQFEVDANKLLNFAYKKIDKSDYLNALPILKKALNEDKENVDVLLELAFLYSRVNILDMSNKYAYEALKLEHNESSLYIIGNNFLKMHKYDTGLVYYKRLLDMYPDGEYADYVDMVVERIEDKETTGRELKLLNLTHKGKGYIEKEQYHRAIRLFSLLSSIEPDQAFIKNNLAMAYFYNKQYDKAIKLCKEILSTNKYDVYTNCNLALFYYKIKDKIELKKQVEKLSKLKPFTQEEFVKLITTYCELKCHEEVNKTVKQAITVYSCDITYMFFLAVANYNIGNVNKALSYYRDILRLDELNYNAHYYIKAINSLMKPKKIDYYNQLPVAAIIDCVKRLKALAEATDEALHKMWSPKDRMIVSWGLKYNDDSIKRISINILEAVGDENSINDLLNGLFSINISDDVKKDILAALRLLDVKQPYSAYFGGDILDVKVSVAAINRDSDLVRPQKAIDLFHDSLTDEYDSDLIKECVDMYIMILNSGFDKEFKSLNALCAVIEMSVRELFKKPFERTELIKRYHTTEETVDKYGNRLAQLLTEAHYHDMAEYFDEEYEDDYESDTDE
ncbi:MAG: hypothetical protein IJR47_03670 [Clostridia bacterium]|nr:hypothetical protein [Clostridia bacterium]